ncbi:MAG: hypothetical protein JNK45_23265 [Myxococcales bacterium]|nr:hypothetical protein [Myxococcales bacterium]
MAAPNSDLRARAKIFFNAVDFDQPIDFGLREVLDTREGRPESQYVPGIHGAPDSPDPVQELADQIDLSASAGSYLFTGGRGTGKTTELMRLTKLLDSYSCEVFYADMSDYLPLSDRIEVSDVLITVLGALSEKFTQRFGGENPTTESFFTRARQFLTSRVRFDEVTVPLGALELKAAIKDNPTFKSQLQERTRGHIEELVREARKFALEVVSHVRAARNDPAKKVVLIIDSLEQLRGVGDSAQVREVFKSAETVFSANADKLRFTGLTIVYTVPPYLSAIAGALGSLYAGGRIYSLPSIHVFEKCPEPGCLPEPSRFGISKMVSMIDRRYEKHDEFFARDQLERLALSSGGDLRDFLRMIRLAITNALTTGVPLTDDVIAHAENAVRSDMLPLADDDRGWLERVAHSHQAELPSIDALPEFARLQQGKRILQYRNGEDWYAPHPLLRTELERGTGSG